MISKGLFVKVIFRNGTQLEGIVESWSDSKAVLTSTDKTNSLIIMNVAEDVMLIKITTPPQTIQEMEEEAAEIEETFEEVKAEPTANDLRLKQLAELKDLMVKQEKKIVLEKVKTLTHEGPQPVQYKYPPSFYRGSK